MNVSRTKVKWAYACGYTFSKCFVKYKYSITVPEVSLEFASYVVAENVGVLEVCVILTTPVGTVVDVDVILTSGSARQGMYT